MPYWSFNEYADNRDLMEAGMLKKWKNRILGRDDDAEDGVAMAHAKRHKDDAVGTATGVGSMINRVGGLAANVATGNVMGAVGSIWGLISDAVSTGTKAYKATNAALYVIEIRKHMAALKKHLAENEDLDDETADAIIDAVFEVDEKLFRKVSEEHWAEGTKRFAAGLAGGYDNIGDKIFAAVMAQVIREWVEEMGYKVDGIKASIAKLRGEKAQKIEFLNEPEIAEAMAEFDPPEVEKELQKDVKQLPPGTPRTINQLASQVGKIFKWPRLPRNGDLAGWVDEEGRVYCNGKLNLNNPEIFTDHDLKWIAEYGWTSWLRSFRVTGQVEIDRNAQCRWYPKAYFGYMGGEAKDMIKWNANKNMWVVNFDPD